jgi:hypothetical protein
MRGITTQSITIIQPTAATLKGRQPFAGRCWLVALIRI